MNCDWPLVSIVTPSLNQGRFLRDTIESVLGQDYPRLEYWVIDGGSTDETKAVLESYQLDPRLGWLMEKDGGQADAINKGWKRCSGQILAWLNSDDVYYPGAIRRQVEALLAHPGVGLVYADVDLIDEDGRKKGAYCAEPLRQGSLLRMQHIPQPSIFLRRELLEHHGYLNSALHFSMDYELLLRLVHHTAFFFNRQKVAGFRIHPAAKTVSQRKSAIEESLRVLQQQFEQFPKLRPLKRRTLADWHWASAVAALDAGDARGFLRSARQALTSHPFRPRAGMVGLRAVDEIAGTSLFEGASRLLTTLRRSRLGR